MLNSLFNYPKLIKIPEQVNSVDQKSMGLSVNSPLHKDNSIFSGINKASESPPIGNMFSGGNFGGEKENKVFDNKTGENFSVGQAKEINQQRMDKYKQKIHKNNEGVNLHEEAHLGPAATSGINLTKKTDKFGNDIVTKGHVMVRIPKELNEKQPLEKIKHEKMMAKHAADQAIAPQTKGVPAPHNELSNADRNVFSKSMKVFQKLIQTEQKRENLNTKIEKMEGKKPEGIIETKKVDKAQKTENQGNAANGNQRRNQHGQVINFLG